MKQNIYVEKEKKKRSLLDGAKSPGGGSKWPKQQSCTEVPLAESKLCRSVSVSCEQAVPSDEDLDP